MFIVHFFDMLLSVSNLCKFRSKYTYDITFWRAKTMKTCPYFVPGPKKQLLLLRVGNVLYNELLSFVLMELNKIHCIFILHFIARVLILYFLSSRIFVIYILLHYFKFTFWIYIFLNKIPTFYPWESLQKNFITYFQNKITVKCGCPCNFFNDIFFVLSKIKSILQRFKHACKR